MAYGFHQNSRGIKHVIDLHHLAGVCISLPTPIHAPLHATLWGFLLNLAYNILLAVPAILLCPSLIYFLWMPTI